MTAPERASGRIGCCGRHVDQCAYKHVVCCPQCPWGRLPIQVALTGKGAE